MIQAILFDKDGTLFDFRRSWGRWAGDFITGIAEGPAHAAALAEALGWLPETRDFRPDSLVIAATAREVAEALVPLLPGRTLEQVLAEVDHAAGAVEMAPAVELVPLLSGLRRRGLHLGVATNDSELPARRHLAAHDILPLFDWIAGHDSGHGAKPGPGMCLAFLQATGIAPRDAVMVGDSSHDLLAGRAAGMHCVAVLTGIATAADLAPLADVVLPDIAALPDWLDAMDAG